VAAKRVIKVQVVQMVSTHSHPKVAARCHIQNKIYQSVSTHSRTEATAFT